MIQLTMNGLDIKVAVKPLPVEKLVLAEALQRVVAGEVLASSACPPHAESLRDGYVLAPPVAGESPKEESIYPLVGEIAAGLVSVTRLEPGTACRIFTGGIIPEGGERVVPQEECWEAAGTVRVPAAAMGSDRLFINQAGSEVASGTLVVGKGARLTLDHLTLLAAVGVHHVAVATRPRVACFCTGSELVAVGERPLVGQKLSLNSMLLQHLIPSYGGNLIHQGLISDNAQSLDALFATLAEGNYHLAISTGGMGPGKYDLVKESFRRAGGKILLQTLPILPGRSILLGILGETLFIALPGPPSAVRTLVNEFVGPIILLLQGAQFPWPKKIQAQLMEDCRMRQSDIVQVKGGVLQLERGMVMVRPAARLDTVSCFIHFEPGRREFAKGEMVEVHVNGADTALYP